MADINPDALITASEAAAYVGVTVATVCNWVGRGHLAPAKRADGTVIRDCRRRILYRLLDVAKAEHATSKAARRDAIFRAA